MIRRLPLACVAAGKRQVAPYLTLMREDAPQREHDLREVFNGLRWLVRSGADWGTLPHDLPPWAAIYLHLPQENGE